MDIRSNPSPQEYLVHYGIKGMKWGVRRYQNSDGTLTSAGRRRYLNSDGSSTPAGTRKYQKDRFKMRRDEYKASISTGKKIFNNLLAGPFANRTYASVKVSGGSNARALGISYAAMFLGGPTGLGQLAVSELYASRAAKGKSSGESSSKTSGDKPQKNISRKQYVQAYNRASTRLNAELKDFNRKFDEKNGGPDWIQRLGTTSKEYDEYIEAFQTLESQYIQEELDKLG